MRGHIAKRGKDSWSIVLYTGRDSQTGKKQYKWHSVKGTKKHAEKELASLINRLDTGNYIKPTKMTIGLFLEQWLKDYAKPNLSPRGFERYEIIIRNHFIPQIGNIPLSQLRPEHLQNLYTSTLNNGLSPGTVRYHHAVIHIALQTALRWGLVGRNIADAVTLPAVRHKDMRTWDEDEISCFLNVTKDTPYHALFYLALFTGMRRSELLALRWSDLDLIQSQVFVTRGLHQLKHGTYVFTEPKSAKSRRTIALPPSATLLLKDHKEKQKLERMMFGSDITDDDLVFSRFDGRPLRPNTVTRAWETLSSKAGLKVIRFHDARHTHASLMLKQGIHPKIVQERLGHASIQMTLDTYSHVVPGLQQAAAELFDHAFNRKVKTNAIQEVGLVKD